jgi:hypothetical protein
MSGDFFGVMKLLILFVLVLISVASQGCSCAHVGILRNKKEAKLVFKGRVTDIHETVTHELLPGTTEQIEYRVTRYTFEILKNHKGLKAKKTIDILTGMTDCEMSFIKNKKYIVYAYLDNKKLHYRLAEQETEPYFTTHLCSRTKKTNVLMFWELFVLWVS